MQNTQRPPPFGSRLKFRRKSAKLFSPHGNFLVQAVHPKLSVTERKMYLQLTAASMKYIVMFVSFPTYQFPERFLFWNK